MLTVARSDRARALTRRARTQLEALKAKLDIWDAQPNIIVSDIVPSAFGTRGRWIVESVDPPDAELEFDLFDSIGNFAKSLDRTVALYAEARGIDPANWRGHFPIALRASDYLGGRGRPPRDAALGDIDPQARELIDAAQPYLRDHPTDSPLALVARWSRYDKHRLGHPTVSVARGMGVATIEHDSGVASVYDLWTALNKRGSRPILAPGTDVFSLFPKSAIEPFLHLLQPNGLEEHNAEISLLARVAVAFGSERDTAFDVRESYDEIEASLLEPLWLRLDAL